MTIITIIIIIITITIKLIIIIITTIITIDTYAPINGICRKLSKSSQPLCCGVWNSEWSHW